LSADSRDPNMPNEYNKLDLALGHWVDERKDSKYYSKPKNSIFSKVKQLAVGESEFQKNVKDIKSEIDELIDQLENKKPIKSRTFTDQNQYHKTKFLKSSIQNSLRVPIKKDETDEQVPAPRSSILQQTGIRGVVLLAKEGKLARIKDEDCSRIVDISHGAEHRHITYTKEPVWYNILPFSRFILGWDIMIVSILFFYFVEIPYIYGFKTKVPFNRTVMTFLEILFTLIFTIDIIIQFFTGFIVSDGSDQGSIETRIATIARRYLFKWFICDVLSAIPFILLNSHPIFNLFRLLKLSRFISTSPVSNAVEQYFQISASRSRLVKHICYGLILFHWTGSLYWLVCGQDDWSGKWPYHSVDDTDHPERDWHYSKQYSYSFLWAIWVATGTGFPEPPETMLQAVWTIASTLLGVITYAFIIGSVFQIMADMDSEKNIKQKLIQKMSHFLSQRDVPQPFVDTVISYYEYCWDRGIDVDSEDLFGNMHSSLKRTMKLAINERVIMKVPMFRDITEPCLEMLIGLLTSRIYLPDEWVCIKGERGDEMFFVIRGKFEVLPTLESECKFILKPGNSFGEMALLMNHRRNCCIRSISHGELLVLRKQEFKEMLREFPIFSISLQKWSPQVRLSKGWTKIRHAVRLCKALSRLGLRQPFECMMRDISIGDMKNSDTQRTKVRSENNSPRVRRVPQLASMSIRGSDLAELSQLYKSEPYC